MTKLPAPYAFEMSGEDLEAGLETVLQMAKLQRKAFEAYAFETEAQRHFMRRFDRVPKDKLDKLGYSVAQALARAARLTPDGELEVRQAMTAMAKDTRMSYGTFESRLAALSDLDLIKIVERGSRNGHPFHIRLNIAPKHHNEIARQTSTTIRAHLEMQKRRFTLLEPSSG